MTDKNRLTPEIFAKWPKARQNAWIARKEGYIDSIELDVARLRVESDSIREQLARYKEAAFIEGIINEYRAGTGSVRRQMTNFWTERKGGHYGPVILARSAKLIPAFQKIDAESVWPRLRDDYRRGPSHARTTLRAVWDAPAGTLRTPDWWRRRKQVLDIYNEVDRQLQLEAIKEAASNFLGNVSRPRATGGFIRGPAVTDEEMAAKMRTGAWAFVAPKVGMRVPVSAEFDGLYQAFTREQWLGEPPSVTCKAILDPQYMPRNSLGHPTQLTLCGLPRGHTDNHQRVTKGGQLHIWGEPQTVGYAR